MNNYTRLCIIILLTCCSIPLMEGAGFYPIRNFGRMEYGGGTQNWEMVQDNSGRTYFANRDGLLKFDGLRWSLHLLPNYTTVRSAMVDSVNYRLYAGGSDEFGYFHIDSLNREMEYKSLIPTISQPPERFGEIWDIVTMDGGKILFRGDYVLFLYDGKQTEKTTLPEKATATLVKDDIAYIGLQDGRIITFDGKETKELGGLEAIRDKKIAALLDEGDDGLLIATSLDGLYTYSDGILTAYANPVNEYLKQNQLFSASRRGDIHAFGTVDGGAVVINFKTGTVNYITSSTGLQNNTVLELGFDHIGNLWLCLDNGISYAVVDSPILDLLGARSDTGAGYASLVGGSNLFLGTNRGLYATPYPVVSGSHPPLLQKLLSGQVWHIRAVDDDIFISADGGLYHSRMGTFPTAPVKIEGIPEGAWYTSRLKSNPDLLLVSTYRKFYLLKRENGRWVTEGPVEGFEDAGGKFVEDDNGDIWIAHWIRGVYKLTLDADNLRFTGVRLFTSKEGLPHERDNSVSIVDGKVVVASASGKFYRLSTSGEMAEDTVLSKRIPLSSPVHYYPGDTGVSFAVSSNLFWKITEKADGEVGIDSVSFRTVAPALIPGFENLEYYDGNTLLVSQQEGFYFLDISGEKGTDWESPVFVERVTTGDSILYTHTGSPRDYTLKIPYEQNSITLHLACPEYRKENAILFSYRLENYDEDWSSPTTNANKEYTRLTEGTYTFQIRAENTLTGHVAEGKFRFEILPPWYRTAWAKIIYTILTVGLIYLAFLFLRNLSLKNARKVEKRKEEELQRLRREAEQEALQKDYEIAALKGKQLEQDIKHKSSELSNITMNVIRKNEMLQNISSKIARLQENHGGRDAKGKELSRELERLQQIINDNISHDDDWKRFNQNFDIVYENFTKRLLELHPGLSISERRLCCYLKMGLSSKEIAPLFNISAKSVEMNRYRLRRKMDLERSVNLVSYLQSL